MFLLLLAAVGWIGWLQFTFCAVRELIAQVRGRTWHAPRGMGASQRTAALLIGSILVLLPTSSALASDAQAAPATTATRVPGQAQAQAAETQQAQAQAPAASTPESRMTYTVREARPAESLWGIAEKELGDGERWREIADLNEGRTMADGTVFRANSFLQPGWRLQMPETASVIGGARTQLGDSAPAVDEKEGHVVTVRSGDYLSKIAEEELGDGNEWPQLFEASRGKPQPHGLPEISDPDVVYAGQQVTVPGSETDHESDHPPRDRGQGEASGSQEATPPATQNPDGSQRPGDRSTGNAQAPVPSQSATPAPQSSTPTVPSSRPNQRPGQEQDSPPAAASATPEPTASASASAASPPAVGGAVRWHCLYPQHASASEPGDVAYQQPAEPADRARRRCAARCRHHRCARPA